MNTKGGIGIKMMAYLYFPMMENVKLEHKYIFQVHIQLNQEHGCGPGEMIL